jgi:hypothetical protein
LEEYKKAPDVTRRRMYLETMERVLSGTDKIIIDGKVGQGVVPIHGGRNIVSAHPFLCCRSGQGCSLATCGAAQANVHSTRYFSCASRYYLHLTFIEEPTADNAFA